MDRWVELNGIPGRLVGRKAVGEVGGDESVDGVDDRLGRIWWDKSSV